MPAALHANDWTERALITLLLSSPKPLQHQVVAHNYLLRPHHQQPIYLKHLWLATSNHFRSQDCNIIEHVSHFITLTSTNPANRVTELLGYLFQTLTS